MSHSTNNRFVASSSSSSSSVPSSGSKYAQPDNKYNDSSQRNRFLKPGSFKSSSGDGWKSLKCRQRFNKFSKINHRHMVSNEQKIEFTSTASEFPSLSRGTNVANTNSQNTLNYSKAINEDIETHKKNKQPPPRKFVSLVSLKKKKNDEDVKFVQDFEREEEYIDTNYFTEDEEEYYEDEEQLRLAEQDYDY